MSEDYQKLILDKIKVKVNEWVSELKAQHKELMLTHQWQALFPKGFTSGFISIPVITGSKKGKHLIATVEFVLPADLTLSVDDIELILKNEPFKQQEQVPDSADVADHIDILNNIVTGLNEFIGGFQLNTKTEKKTISFLGQSLKTADANRSATSIHLGSSDSELIPAASLPDWIKTITDEKIKAELISKVSSAWKQHKSSTIGASDIDEFMDKYTAHLLNHGHLHHYCSYKGRSVKLDSNGWCTESFCSKKPWESPCPIVQLKFGKES